MKTPIQVVGAALLALALAFPVGAAEVDQREAKIHNEIKTDRAANGGKLTPAERAKVNRQQNRTSRAIYRKKHNPQHQ